MERLLIDALILVIGAVLGLISVAWGWQGVMAREIVLRGHHYKGIVAVLLSAILVCIGTSTSCIVVYQVARFIQGASPFLLPR